MQAQMAVTLALSTGTSIVTESIFENRFRYVSELNKMGAGIRVEGNTAIISGVDNTGCQPYCIGSSGPVRHLLSQDLQQTGLQYIDDIKYVSVVMRILMRRSELSVAI